MIQNCEQCGLEYDAKRSSSKFCSTKCRVLFARDKSSVTRVTVTSDDNVTLTTTDGVTLKTDHIGSYTGGSDS